MSLDALISVVARHVEHKVGGGFAKPLPSLGVLAADTPTEFDASVYEPVLCLILQGMKEVEIGDDTLKFGRGECLLVSHDLPVWSRITQAPYLALILEVDVQILRNLYDQVEGTESVDEPAYSANVRAADPLLVDALKRYVDLADAPRDARVLSPLILREIHYRLLVGAQGAMLRRLIRHDSVPSAIARAIRAIRDDLRAPMKVPELAKRVGMSTSAFHQHFKAVTSTTPLQYQKELRLLEARRLLRLEGATVTSAAFEVGYQSSSQFSREYARKFGTAPSRETA